MGKVKVKKGNEVYEIDNADLQNAVADGFSLVATKKVEVSNGKEVLIIDDSDLQNALKDGYSLKKKDGSQDLLSGSNLFPGNLSATIKERTESISTKDGKRFVVNASALPQVVANPEEYLSAIKKRIEQGNPLPGDLQAIKMANPTYTDDEIQAYVYGSRKLGNDKRMRNFIAKNNQDYGLNDNAEEILKDDISIGDYIEKISGKFGDKKSTEINAQMPIIPSVPYQTYSASAASEIIDKRSNLEKKAVLDFQDFSKDYLSHLKEEGIRKVVGNEEITKEDKVKRVNALLKGQKAERILESSIKQGEQDVADESVERTGLEKVSKFLSGQIYGRNAVEWMLGRDVNKNLEILKSDRFDAEAAINNVIYKEAETLAAEMATATPERKQEILAEIEKLKPQLTDTKELMIKYPSKAQMLMAQGINEMKLSMDSNIKGNEGVDFSKEQKDFASSYIGQNVIKGPMKNGNFNVNVNNGKDAVAAVTFLQSEGYLSDPKLKPIADGLIKKIIQGEVSLKDPSIFGGLGKSLTSAFSGALKGVGDIMGIRTVADAHADNLLERGFPTEAENLKGGVKIAKNIVNTTGNVISQAALQMTGAGMARGVGLGAKLANNVGFWASGALPQFDDSYKQSIDIIENEAGRKLFALFNGGVAAATEKIFPESKILNIPGVRNSFAEISQRFANGELTGALYNELMGKAKNAAWQFAKDMGSDVTKETLEEVIGKGAELASRVVAGDESVTWDSALGELKETAYQTATGTLLVGAMGAYSDAQKRKFNTNAKVLYAAAQNHDEAHDAIMRKFEKDSDADARDLSIRTLNTSADVLEGLNVRSKQVGVKMDDNQKALYVANKTAQLLLESQKTKDKNDVINEKIDAKIAELRNQELQLFDGKLILDDNLNEVVPVVEGDNLQPNTEKDIFDNIEDASFDDNSTATVQQEQPDYISKPIELDPNITNVYGDTRTSTVVDAPKPDVGKNIEISVDENTVGKGTKPSGAAVVVPQQQNEPITISPTTVESTTAATTIVQESNMPVSENKKVDEGGVSVVKEVMGDNELQQIVGRDVFKQIQRSEEQLGEGVVDRNRMIETAKRIQKADKKDKLLPEHIFEALQYETGFPDNWQDLRNAIKKGGIDINSESVQRQIEVGVDLPRDIVEEFKKSERYKKATPELKEAIEKSLKEQSKEITPISPNERDAMVQDAVAVAKKIEGTSMFAQMLKESAESGDMVDFEDNVKSVAEQANDPDSYNGAVKIFGQDMVDMAQKMFPKEKTETVVSERPGGLNKSQVDKIINKLDSLKIDTSGTLGINLFPAAWNASLAVVKLAIKSGKSIYEAVNDGISYMYNKILKDDIKDFAKWLNGAVIDVKEKVNLYSKILFASTAFYLGITTNNPSINADNNLSNKKSVVDSNFIDSSHTAIRGMVEKYFYENEEDVPVGAVDRAIDLWNNNGRPIIIPDTATDARAFAIRSKNVIGNISNFDDFIAEMSHFVQYNSGAALDSKKYATQEQYDSLEYERVGSVEYDAHKIIEGVLGSYVINGPLSQDAVYSIFEGSKNDELQHIKKALRKYKADIFIKKDVVEWLDSIKIGKGKVFALPPGINLIPAIWNGGIEAIKKSIKLGDKIAVSIQKGITKIRQLMAEKGSQLTKQQEDEITAFFYREFVSLSEKNKRNIDKLVDLTVRQDTDQTKVFEYLDKSVSDAGLAQLLKDYYNAQLQSKGKEVDLRNLGFTKNEILSIRGFERAYREGKRTFPELVDAMNEKALQAETQEEKDTYKKVIDYLYNKYRDEIDFQQAVMAQNSAEGFDEFVNDFKVSITDGALGELVETFGISEDPSATTRLESQDRIGRNLTDEQKGAIRKEATAFAFEQFRVDVDKAITMFQGKYGEKYINEMLSFVKDENNKDDARLAVSVGLHNHIRYLMSNIGESVLTQGELRDVLSKNIITNQQLSRKASLMLNMLRAWNDDKLDIAAIGAVPPEIRTGSEIIREALVSDITDEDLIRYDEGGFQSLEQSEQEAEDNRPKTSKATKSVKKVAKMSAMTSSNLKKRIEERIKLCK